MVWLIYDAAILAALAICIIIYARKGFMASFMGLLAFVMSILLAYWLSGPATPLIYNWFVRDNMYARIEGGNTGVFYRIVHTVMTGSDGLALDAAAISVLRVIVFSAFLLIIYLLLKWMERLFKNVNKAPLVGTVNRLLGGVVGFAIGILVCLVIVFLVSILITASGNALTWMNTALIEETYVFKLFYNFDILKLLLV